MTGNDTLSRATPEVYGTTNQFQVSWTDVDLLCTSIADQLSDQLDSIRGFYGVPRGGVVPATLLAYRLDRRLFERPEPGVVIVDDIYDTGRTMKPFILAGYQTAVLYMREDRLDDDIELTYADVAMGGDWIVFPWEVQHGSD